MPFDDPFDGPHTEFEEILNTADLDGMLEQFNKNYGDAPQPPPINGALNPGLDESFVLHVVNTLSARGIPFTLMSKNGSYVKIAETQLSAVYDAYQQKGRPPFSEENRVVLKVYNQTSIDNFGVEGIRDEGRIQKICYDTGVHTPRLIDHGAAYSPNVAFMLMEHIKGKTLKEILEDKKKWEPKRVLKICSDLAAEIYKMNLAGVAHLDLKPGNVIVQEGTDQPYIFDFGFSIYKKKIPRIKKQCLENPDTIWGTFEYIAPEFLFEKRLVPEPSLLPSTDQYSFGIILYRAATGEFPFPPANTPQEMLDQIAGKQDSIKMRHKLKPGYPNDVTRIIERCLRRDPLRRFISCANTSYSLKHLIERM